MTGRTTADEGGFTLIEIVIAIAIVATTVTAGFGISLASRSLAVSTAAGELDQFLDSARTMARDLDGATLAFVPDAFGDGTEVRLLAGGPNGPPTPTTLPPLHARATIEEAESLGKAPFAFIVHANGSLSGRPGYRVGDTAPTDVGCPPSGAFHFVIKTAGGSADRYVPCRLTLAANGPVALTSWPLAPIAPSPTPCSNGPGCTATSLPNPPSSTASCPPSFTPIAGGCAPAPSTATARYHVTISGAPASITVGTSGSFTAQATLANPNAVAAGTPSSIPVSAQTPDATCAVAPSGWQSSGSSFGVTGTAAGTCTVMVQADPSAIPGATSDIGTLNVTINAAPNATPSPSPSACDLMTNGKCYHRIVDETTSTFTKTVIPDFTCDSMTPQMCWYLDSIRSIQFSDYSFTPAVPPIDTSHELLFKLDRIETLTYDCISYASFALLPTYNPLPLIGSGIGEPSNAPIGFGKPSVFTTANHVFVQSVPDSFNGKTVSSEIVPTLNNLIDTMAREQVGLTYSFTYQSAGAAAGPIIWIPDFPGCDNVGDVQAPSAQYGNVSIGLSFEIFQAT